MIAPAPSRAAALAPAAVALLALAIHAACWSRYGVFRDELYFVACGEHLAWGYVDQPPGIALVARRAHAAFGTWVAGLRLLPWRAGAATVLLAGRLASRLGGGPFAAALASIAALAAPIVAGLGHYLTMNAFEPPLALGLAIVLLRLADGDDPRLWVLAGALAAAATLFKYTGAMLAVALLAGLLASPARRALATPWALAGGALALLLVLPNLLWQARHGFPFLELVRNGQRFKNAPFSPGGFAKDLLLMANPLAAPLALAGAVSLLASRRARFLGAGAVLFVAVLAASRGKAYYAQAALPLLFAGGAVALERRVASRAARGAAAGALLASGLALAPLVLPLLPIERFVRYQAALGQKPDRMERTDYGVLPQLFADQFGWQELARTVAGVYRSLPEAEKPHAAVFGQNYGEAAAIDLYAAPLGLPPAVSGHNSYFLWGVPAGRGDPLIVISGDREGCAGAYREGIPVARVPPSPWVMPYEDARWIWICRGATRPLAELWPAVRLFI